MQHLAKVLTAFRIQRRGAATKWSVCCPAHDDRSPSLSIALGDDAKILCTCHAGCTLDRILASVGLYPSDLFPQTNRRRPARSRIAYPYHDANGTLRFEVLRDRNKKFLTRRPGERGKWINNIQGVHRPLFRLPELLAAPLTSTIYVAEGEKDVETLRNLGLVATTNFGGAGNWRDEYGKHFDGRPTIILPDNDEPGRQHAEQVLDSLLKHGCDARVVALPGLAEGGDVTDWIEGGKTLEDLQALVQETVRSGSHDVPQDTQETQDSQESQDDQEPQYKYVGEEESNKRTLDVVGACRKAAAQIAIAIEPLGGVADGQWEKAIFQCVRELRSLPELCKLDARTAADVIQAFMNGADDPEWVSRFGRPRDETLMALIDQWDRVWAPMGLDLLVEVVRLSKADPHPFPTASYAQITVYQHFLNAAARLQVIKGDAAVMISTHAFGRALAVSHSTIVRCRRAGIADGYLKQTSKYVECRLAAEYKFNVSRLTPEFIAQARREHQALLTRGKI